MRGFSYEDDFLRRVEGHEMTIGHDDGVFRSVRFARPDSSIYAFTLTTWPGYLAITGDCDDFVFSRLRDMFEFFRGPGNVNLGYWAEKCVAISRSGGLRVFDEDTYTQAVVRDFRESLPPGAPGRLSAWREVRYELLEYPPATTAEAVQRACAYRGPAASRDMFAEFWDHNLETYAYGFVWACHAIRWGIEAYDKAKAATAAEVAHG